MSVQEPRRAVQAVAIAAVGVPCALLAHLLVTGAPATPAAAVTAAVAVLVVAAAFPARRAAGLALVTAVAQLAAHSVLAVLAGGLPGGAPACLPAVGRAASLGLHLAVLRADGGCPAGSLAVAPTVATAVTALVTALAILAGHAVVALLAGALLGRAVVAGELLACVTDLLQRVLARTAALLGQVLPLPLPVAPGQARPDHRAPRIPAPHWSPDAISRRGPPRRISPAV